MSAAKVAPKPVIATIMCRVLRFLRNIALRYARQSTLVRYAEDSAPRMIRKSLLIFLLGLTYDSPGS